jgi:asparagine synthase (glutamine-hydrolysing)
MCGICGVLRRSDQDKIDLALIDKMLRSIAHRGPDSRGYFIKNNIFLASQRLKVIDFENGSQPMSNEDESVWLVFNGEIYNFLELRKTLESKGHLFKSKSDTEAIVHLYEEEGPEFVKKIKGMFALAIWDKPKKRLILARDRFGIKPLYYTHSPDMFIFASEPKAILCDPEFKKEIEPSALDSYLFMEYVASPHSIFKNIHKLPAAHILIFADNTVKLSEYWKIKPDYACPSITKEEAQERLLFSSHRVRQGAFSIRCSAGVLSERGDRFQ